MKLSGKNFQPWESFSMDISGFTILIGPSNEGKSSIYRALRGILRNDIDADQVRDPKDKPLELELEYADHTIKAIRSHKGSVKYVIDGKEYAKLAGDAPEIVKELKFGEIKLGDDYTFDPIFANQNRPQFLIDSDAFKPAEINALLGAFGGTEKLEAGKKQANLLKTQKDGEAKVLAAQIRDAEDRKARLSPMVSSGIQITDSLLQLESSARQLEAESYWLGQTLYHRRLLTPLHEILSTLILPDTTGVGELQSAISTAEQAAFAKSFAHWMSRPLAVIDSITGDWNDLLSLWKQIKALSLAAEIVIPDLTELQAFHVDSQTLSILASVQSSINHLERTVGLREEIEGTVEKSLVLEAELSEAQTELQAVQAELQRIELDKARKKVLCPDCGEPMEHICRK